MSRCCLSLIVVSLVAANASAQPCGHWADGYAINQLGGRIQDSVMFDDGGGSALYVVGEFKNDNVPGRRGVAKWSGLDFVPVGGGLNGPGFSVAVFDDDGAGPNPAALYVGGKFTIAGEAAAEGVAKWDGATWSALGSGMPGRVFVLKGHDDGAGPALYAGGDFVIAGGQFVSGLAMWRDGQWSDVGGGVTFGPGAGSVETIESFQDGLFIGGFFDHAGPLVANGLAEWRDGAFSDVGGGVNANAQITKLLVVDLPSTGGPALIVAGAMSTAGGVQRGPVARWNGSAWASMAAGTSNMAPGSLAVHDDGAGAALYVTGVVGGGTGVSKWNGTSWQLVGPVVQTTGVPLGLDTLTSMPGNGLFLGGMFMRIAGAAMPMAAVMQGGTWSPLGAWGLGLDAAAHALEIADVGDGTRLYVGGSFRLASGVPAAGVARLGPSGWEVLATSILPATGTIRNIKMFDDGTGPALFVSGSFASINGVAAVNVARWRPATGWSTAGPGLNDSSTGGVAGNVFSMAVHQDPGAAAPSLFATGLFRFSGGANPITNVARWTGSGWASVGNGGGPNGTAGAFLASLDPDGPGGNPARLYFGGVGLLPVNSWNGMTWTPDPATVQATVLSHVGVFDLGEGPTLFAGGDITSPFAGSVAIRGATAWQNLGVSPRFPNAGGSGAVAANGSVMGTLTLADQDGLALYMTGIFGAQNAEGYQNAARWNGTLWEGLGGGLASRFPGTDGRGSAMLLFDDGSGLAIFIVGKFERYYETTFNTFTSNWTATYNIAKWVPCLPPNACPADFNGDGFVDPDDLSDFITCFFLDVQFPGVCPASDFNADGFRDPDDLSDFITAFFTSAC